MKFDAKIQQRIKADNCGYKGYKPSPQDWADILEQDTNFSEEFKSVYNNYDITQEDGFKPEVIEETCVAM